ncbi:MAG: formylglycine-generating enzyme family protein [Pseudomonadota bacterium]
MTDNMVWIPPGQFPMGSMDFYPEEQPVRTVKLDGFWIDAAPVTRRDFEVFVEETGYVTVAEKDLDARDYPGVNSSDLAAGSLVFTPTKGPVEFDRPDAWWRFVKGACWRRPDGADSTDASLPVVQVAYEDAEAYASWAGKSLPTEAEWEYAAHGGAPYTTYAWGEEPLVDGQVMANTWEGTFPWRNQSRFRTTSPVASFPANNYGLFDMIGNVWEWTDDWWSPDHKPNAGDPCCGPANTRASAEANSHDPALPEIGIPQKVLKGGSHLCSSEYCLRYRPAARIPQMIDSGTSHIGFRCVHRQPR